MAQEIDRKRVEAGALRRSLAGYLVFGALGVGFSIVTGSEAILLDGVYSLICAVVAVGAMHVSGLVLRPDDELHPFGYAKYEPLLNAIKGLLILGTCILAGAGSAAAILFGGGREPIFGVALIYSGIATVGCLWMAFQQSRAARATGSALLKVEAGSWVVDGAISGAVGLCFLAAMVLQDSRFEALVPFLDPAIVLLLVCILLPVPLKTVSEAVSQLLFLRPEQRECERVEAICSRSMECAGISGQKRIRSTRVGRAIYILISILLEADDADPPVAAIDDFRKRIAKRIQDDAIAPVVYVDALVTREIELS